MDIGSKKGYPSSALSNFAPHPFYFDGIWCASMEGLLQAFKFKDANVQVEVCKLVGLKAKYRGKKRNKAWKRIQTLWWMHKEYKRGSDEYQELLDRAYDALATNTKFQKALLATGNAVLKHTIGSSDPSNTVLTRQEFCSRLTKIRERLKK
jgi:predicted NAD-dependent protein-ADP-ribosyltransferase YbiA (DUF1768 family)